MRLAARFIVTMAVALVIVPALYADDAAKPATDATKDETAASVIVPGVAAEAQPNTNEMPPVRFSKSRESLNADPPQAAGKLRGSGDSEHYTPRIEWFLGYSFW